MHKMTIFSLLLTLYIGIFVDSVSASYYDPLITIESPIQGVTYNENNIVLKYNITFVPPSEEFLRDNLPITLRAYCLLDQKYIREIDPHDKENIGEISLDDLRSGNHTVQIVAIATYYMPYHSSSTVDFFVDVAPTVSIICLDTYQTSDVSLTIQIDVPISKLKYTLDSELNTTIPIRILSESNGSYQYSLNLTQLSQGNHTLMVYALDDIGNIGTAAKTFTIKTQQNQTTIQSTPATFEWPTSTAVIVITLAIIATILTIAILLIFHNKHP